VYGKIAPAGARAPRVGPVAAFSFGEAGRCQRAARANPYQKEHHLDDARAFEEQRDRLDAYLTALTASPRGPVEERLHLRRCWHQVFAEATLSLDGFLVYRVRYAYRLARLHARIKRALQPGDALGAGLTLHAPTADPWHASIEYLPTNDLTPPFERSARAILAERPMPLFPHPGMSPAEREDFVDLTRALARCLGLDEAAPGFAPMLDPATVVETYPSPFEALTFEEVACQEAQASLVGPSKKVNRAEDAVQGGQGATLERLQERYGFQRDEALAFVRMAKARVREEYKSDIEEERAFHVARLDDVIRRCQSALNIRDEIKALVQLAKVQGLTRVDPEDEIADFVAAVKRVTTAAPIDVVADASIVEDHAEGAA